MFNKKFMNKIIAFTLFMGFNLIVAQNHQTYLKTDSIKKYNVLFIGNSLTYTNNLPLFVKKAAKAPKVVEKIILKTIGGQNGLDKT